MALPLCYEADNQGRLIVLPRYVARAWRHPANHIRPITVPPALHRALRERLPRKALKMGEEQDRQVLRRKASSAPDAFLDEEEQDGRRESVQQAGTGLWEDRKILDHPKVVKKRRPPRWRRGSRKLRPRESLQRHTDNSMEKRSTPGTRARPAPSTQPRDEKKEYSREEWDNEAPQVLLRRQPGYDKHQAAAEKTRVPKPERVKPMKDGWSARTVSGQSISEMEEQAAPGQDARRAWKGDDGVSSEEARVSEKERVTRKKDGWPPRTKGDQSVLEMEKQAAPGEDARGAWKEDGGVSSEEARVSEKERVTPTKKRRRRRTRGGQSVSEMEEQTTPSQDAQRAWKKDGDDSSEEAKMHTTERVTPMKDGWSARTVSGQSISEMENEAAPGHDARGAWKGDGGVSSEEARVSEKERVTPTKKRRRRRTRGGQSVSEMEEQAAPGEDARGAWKEDGGVSSEEARVSEKERVTPTNKRRRRRTRGGQFVSEMEEQAAPGEDARGAWKEDGGVSSEEARVSEKERVTPTKKRRRRRTRGGQSVSEMEEQKTPRQDAQRAWKGDGDDSSEEAKMHTTERVTPTKDRWPPWTRGDQSVLEMKKPAAPGQDARRAWKKDGAAPSKKKHTDWKLPARRKIVEVMQEKDLPPDVEGVIDPGFEVCMPKKRPAGSNRNRRKTATKSIETLGMKTGARARKHEIRAEERREKKREKMKAKRKNKKLAPAPGPSDSTK